MAEITEFGRIVLIVSGGFALAVLSNKVADWLPIPAPGIFLLAAAVASDVFPSLGRALSIKDVERVAVVALLLILFDGGMRIGWRRFRRALAPIVSLGVLGTFATAALIALASRYLLNFSWTTSGILGAALAPTDPAVMFSVLGQRGVGGRTGVILEGESGANDPVGIALMIGMIDFATKSHASAWVVVREFSVEMSVGLAIGVAGAAVLLPALRRIALPNEALYPLRTLGAAGVVYGAAALAHGSGFLAVFVAGILLGDRNLPYKHEIERFHTSLASLAEIVVFVALGLTVDLAALGRHHVWEHGLVLAVILAFAARPLVIGTLLVPTRLRRGERFFVMWSGLKGAVPILLAAFTLLAGVEGADRIYGIVFVVVAFSVVLQGMTIPLLASRAGVHGGVPGDRTG
ncbi:MAG: cation:proton antiporter [Gaiellaceae bacterium]